MTGKTVCCLLVLFLMAGCGGEPKAALDAKITGPDDTSFTVPPSSSPQTFIVRGLDFQVRSKESIAIPGVEIEFFAGGSGVLTDINGNPLPNTAYLKTTADDRGVGRVSFRTTVPACGAEDREISGSVMATVGVASDIWVVTYKVVAC